MEAHAPLIVKANRKAMEVSVRQKKKKYTKTTDIKQFVNMLHSSQPRSFYFYFRVVKR